MAEPRTLRQETNALPVKSLYAEVLEGPDQGLTCRPESDTLSIGTARSNDLALTDELVSRFHAELRRTHDQIQLTDLGSTNGTFHGRFQIERGWILPDSTIRVGRTTLRIADGDLIEVALHDRDDLSSLRGRSSGMRRLMARIERVAATDSSVVIHGETGTGKELIAESIHERSARADGPFETVDCASLSPTLVSSELFGHEKGAFTGAERAHAGAFERAHGGTLFLDEIGELPAPLQATLLGALERKQIRRLGAKAPVPIDVRVIAATHRDLREEVNAGRFRADLFFRLAVVTLEVPPLRERTDDIPLLIDHFLNEAGREESAAALFPPEVMDWLQHHRWPGNVRELRNFVEATLALGEHPPLEGKLRSPSAETPPPAESRAVSERGPEDWLEPFHAMPLKTARTKLLQEFEVAYLKRLLAECEGNLSEVARRAQMNRTHLFTILRRAGIR